MNNKTISILGSGWLGVPLAEALIQQGYAINLSSRSTAKDKLIRDIGAIPYLVNIDTRTYPNDFFNADMLICNITSKNIEGFSTLIERIGQSQVQQVLFISSSSVYLNTNTIVTEDALQENPQHPLYRIEQLFQQAASFDSTIVRFSGLVGYQRHPGRFFKQGKIVPQANAPVNLIHRDDCIALIQAIIEQAAWGDTFNACADTHPTKRIFYQHASELLGQKPPEFDDTAENQYKIVSNAKIKKRLGYQFIYPDVMQIPFD